MHVLVIDDDSIFCEVMKRTGLLRGIEVTTCSVLEKMNRPDTWKFDAAIVDYDLDYVDGVELSEYIRHFGSTVPILLVSQTARKARETWPHGISGFLPKSIGAQSILDEALRLQSHSS